MGDVFLTANQNGYSYAQFFDGFVPHSTIALVKVERLRNIARARVVSCIMDDGNGWTRNYGECGVWKGI